MRWQLLIAVIAVAVWILSSLVRGAGDQKVRRPRPNVDPDQPPDRPGRKAAEIDRFLQEVQRRRQRGERPPEARTPDAEIPLAIPVEPPPPPRPTRRATRAEAPRPAPERATGRRRTTEPALPLAVEASAAPPAPVSPWQEPVPAAAPPPGPAAPGAAPAQNATARQLIELLRNPRTQATAYALREILDRPVSQRRRG